MEDRLLLKLLQAHRQQLSSGTKTDKTLRGFYLLQTRAEKDFNPVDFAMSEEGIYGRNMGTLTDLF